MAAGYTVRISAVDAATQTLNGINQRFDAMNKRVMAAMAPFKELGESIDKFTSVTGIDKIATGFKNLAVAGVETARSMAKIIEPLAAITGAATIAGLYRLTAAWGDFSTALSNQAQRAGLSANSLNGLQNAAKLAGVDAGTLTQSMTTLGDQMRVAAFGGAPQFLMVLRGLKLSYEDLKKMKPEDQLRVIAQRLSEVQNPTDRADWTRTVFGSEGLLPFLREGAAGIERYQRLARNLGRVVSPEDIDRANRFRLAQEGLGIAVSGLSQAIGNVLAPVLAPLVEQLSGAVAGMHHWVDANQEWLRGEISAKVGQFVTWMKSVDWQGMVTWIGQIATRVNDVAQALGGWTTVGETLLALSIGRWLIGFSAPFVALAVNVASLTVGIGSGLVRAFGLAEAAAIGLNARAMGLPLFRFLAGGGLVAALGALLYGTARGYMDAGKVEERNRALEQLNREQRDGGVLTPQDGFGPDGRPLDGSAPVESSWGRWFRGVFGIAQPPRNQAAMGFPGYTGPDATQGTGGDRNIRNNNPTNLMFAGQPGATSDGRFARFPNMESGVASNLNQFLLYQDRDHLRSIEQMILRATPRSENPGVDAYIDRVAATMGMRRSDIPDLHDRNVAARWIMGIAPNEGGTPNAAAVQRGVDARLGWPGTPSVVPTGRPSGAPVIAPSGPPAALPSAAAGQAGAAGANGKVDMNVRVSGAPAVVTSRATGAISLNVVSTSLTTQ